MLSAKATLDKRTTEGEGNLLRGQDLPRKTQSLKIKVTGVREAPSNFNSPVILDIEAVCDGKTAFPLNKTNVRRCVELVGDNLELLNGATLVLNKMLVNNPKTNKLTFGLVIQDISGSKKVTKKKR